MLAAKKIAQVVLVIVSVCLFSGVGAMAGDVFESVPGDALFAVRINNYEGTLGQLDQFLSGITPMPNPTSMMTRMQLANMVGDPDMNNVDLKGQMAVFGRAIPQGPNSMPEIFIGILLPVADYGKFISSNATATKPDANGVSTIGQMKMLVMKSGSYAVFSPVKDSKGLVLSAKAVKTKNLSQVLGTGNAEISKAGNICAYGDVQQATKQYGPMIFAQLDAAQKGMAGKDPNMAMPTKLMSVYFEALKRLLNESKTINLQFSPKPESLNLTGTFTAMPGTKLADILASKDAEKAANPLLGYLPENALMNMGGRMDKTKTIKMYEEFVEIFSPVLGPKFTPEEKTKLIALIKSSVNALGKSYVSSSVMEPNSKPPFSGLYVFEVADNAAFQKSIDVSLEMLKAPYIEDLMKTFGVQVSYEMKRDAEKYKGISIDVTKVKLKSSDPNSALGKMMIQIYGESVEAKLAMVKGLELCAMGANADARIKWLIDKAQSGKPGVINAELKKAIASIQGSEQALCVGTYNYLRAFQMSAGFMPGMPFNTGSLRQIVSKSNIAFACNIDSGVVTLNLAVPKEHVLEIKSALEMIMPKPNQKQAPAEQAPPEE